MAINKNKSQFIVSLKRNNKYSKNFSYNQKNIDNNIQYQNNSIDCKKIKWSIFDKIYCIHYLPYKERLEFITNELTELGIIDLPQFEWYYTVPNNYYNSIVDVSDTHINYENINYSINMLNLYKICQMQKYKKVLFIEDDIHVQDKNKLAQYINNQPEDANYIQYEFFCNRNIDFDKTQQQFINISSKKYSTMNFFDTGFVQLDDKAIVYAVHSLEQQLTSIDNIDFDNTIQKYIINDQNLVQQKNYSNKQGTNLIQNLKNKNDNCSDYKIALVCIAKDEDLYIDEWIDYHLKLGFSKIFIYANNWNYRSSNDKVVVIKWDNKLNLENTTPCVPQCDAYNSFIEKNSCAYDFALFIDCDEFLTLKDSDNISEFIQKHDLHKNYATSFQWRIFGDSGIQFDENETSVLKRFKRCSRSLDKQFKTLVNLSKTHQYKFFDPHHGYIKNELKNVDLLGNAIQNVDGNYSNNIDEMLDIGYISHFRTKTYQEFIQKCNRNNSGDFQYDYKKCLYHNDSPVFMTNNDFNEWNINEVADYTAYNFFYDKKTKYVEVKLSGRFGNIILEIASAFIFCKKHNIPYKNIIIDKKYDFINLANELVQKDYLKQNFDFFKDIPDIEFIDKQTDQRVPQLRLAVESGNMIEISLSNSLHNDTRYDSINFNEFTYIRLNSFYQNSDYENQYKEIVKYWISSHNWFSDKKEKHDYISYCIRLGDFKRFLPNLLKTDDQIKLDIKKLLDVFQNRKIKIFSDDINRSKQILADYKNKIAYYAKQNEVNDFTIFKDLVQSFAVHGNMYSTFIFVSRLFNIVLNDKSDKVYWQPELK